MNQLEVLPWVTKLPDEKGQPAPPTESFADVSAEELDNGQFRF